jgi:hypothetical protein
LPAVPATGRDIKASLYPLSPSSHFLEKIFPAKRRQANQSSAKKEHGCWF